MAFPQPNEYNEAIQNLRSTVSDEELRAGEAAVNALGMPMPSSGNFADVYKVHCPATGSTWAVKCFTREVAGLKDRYRGISEHLQKVPFSFMVEFHYVEPGVRINKQWYPFLKMRWVEGLRLNQFVCDYLDKPKTLRLLQPLWVKLSAKLREAKIAHGDLQHGNVLLVPVPETGQLSLKLIDYDGMYVPALAKMKSGEVGHPSFQHPQRIKEAIYNVEVDRFSHLAIYTAIQAAIVGKRELWDQFDNGDNLLFREADFQHPETSDLLRRLWETPGQPELHSLVGRLILACKRPLNQCPHLDELVFNGVVLPLSPEMEQQVCVIVGRGAPAVQAVPQFQQPTGGIFPSPGDVQAVLPVWQADPAAAWTAQAVPVPGVATVPEAVPLATGLAGAIPGLEGAIPGLGAPLLRPYKRFGAKRNGALPWIAAGLGGLGLFAIICVALNMGGSGQRESPPSGLASAVSGSASNRGTAGPKASAGSTRPQPVIGSATSAPPAAPSAQAGTATAGPVAAASAATSAAQSVDFPSNLPSVPATDAPAVPEEPTLPIWQPTNIRRLRPPGEANSPLVLSPGSDLLVFDGVAMKNVKTGKRVGSFQDRYASKLQALSPDGRLYAAAHPGGDPFGKPLTLTVLSTEDGSLAGELHMPVNGVFQSEVKYLRFTGPETLLAVRGFFDNWVLIYDVGRKKVTNTFQIKDFAPERSAISEDGGYFITGNLNAGIQVYELKRKKPVCTLGVPPGSTGGSNVQGIEFSPDGTEIAACCEGRVVCWNQHGDVVFNCQFFDPSLQTFATDLAWLPDGSGWFAANHFLVLREPKAVVWRLVGDQSLISTRREEVRSRFLSKDELLIVRNNATARQMDVVPVPWEMIHRALEGMESKRAYFRPGDNVQLDVHMGPSIATDPQMPTLLMACCRSALASSGYVFVNDAPRTIRVCYAEPPAGAQSVLIDGVPFAVPRATAVVAPSAVRGCLFVNYLVDGRSEPVWKFFLDSAQGDSPPSQGTSHASIDPPPHVVPAHAALQSFAAMETFAAVPPFGGPFGPPGMRNMPGMPPMGPRPFPGGAFAPPPNVMPPSQAQQPPQPPKPPEPLATILKRLLEVRPPSLLPKDPKALRLPIVTAM